MANVARAIKMSFAEQEQRTWEYGRDVEFFSVPPSGYEGTEAIAWPNGVRVYDSFDEYSGTDDENCSSCGQLHPRERFYGGCPNCGAPHQ